MTSILDFKYDPNDEWVQIEEVLHNLNTLVKAGKVRHVGLSNETPWGVMKYLQISKEKKTTKDGFNTKRLQSSK